MNIKDYRSTIPKTNYSSAVIEPKGIVLHITRDTRKNNAVEYFQKPTSRVSSHYVVEPDGEISYCVNENNQAYHAGIVKRPTAQIIIDNKSVNPNSYMIGIEVVSFSGDLPKVQMVALCDLVMDICQRRKIQLNRYSIIGHNEINVADKYFDPVYAFSVNEVINNIMFTSKVAQLEKEIAILKQQDIKEEGSVETWKLEIMKEGYKNKLFTDFDNWMKEVNEGIPTWAVIAMINNAIKVHKEGE
jgi:N-acetyl-anhydromuramyl-L-alanine amidase AmpD